MPVAVRQAPGGSSSIVLGADPSPAAAAAAVSSNRFASGANQNAGNVLTDRSSTRVQQGPGGSSTICLGADMVDARPACKPVAAAKPGAAEAGQTRAAGVAQRDGMNAFANGANQNAGNSIGGRPSTRVHAGPGGNSTLCLGADEPTAGQAASTSSNRWANGANQNAGNIITDRPSTRIHYGPGGATSICLGMEVH